MDAKRETWKRVDAGKEVLFINLAVSVCTAYWDRDSWVKHTDWTIAANRAALERTLESMKGDTK